MKRIQSRDAEEDEVEGEAEEGAQGVQINRFGSRFDGYGSQNPFWRMK